MSIVLCKRTSSRLTTTDSDSVSTDDIGDVSEDRYNRQTAKSSRIVGIDEMLDVGGDGHDSDFTHEGDIVVGSEMKSARVRGCRGRKSLTNKSIDHRKQQIERLESVQAGQYA